MATEELDQEQLDALRINNANEMIKQHFVEGKETFPMIQRVRYALYNNFYIDETTKTSLFDGVPLTFTEPPILSNTNSLEMFDFASDEITNPEEYVKIVGIKKEFVLNGWNFNYPCHFDGINYTRDDDWDKYEDSYPPSIYFDTNVETGEFYYFEVQEPTFVSVNNDGSTSPLNTITWTVRVGLENFLEQVEAE